MFLHVDSILGNICLALVVRLLLLYAFTLNKTLQLLQTMFIKPIRDAGQAAKTVCLVTGVKPSVCKNLLHEVENNSD